MPIFECRALEKRYGTAMALDHIDLALEPGRIVGLLGPNGSGKSTLIKLAMGLLQPTSGEVLIGGQAPSPQTNAVVSYLPDRITLSPWMKTRQLLDFYGDFFADFDRAAAEQMLSQLGLDLNQSVRQMSKGMKEKVQLVLTMSRRAKLYLLVGLNADCFPKGETATETTLDELEALLNTAGGECAGKILQNKHTPDPRSFIGEGKAEEVRQLVLSTGANMVIFDNDLTPSQTRTLEDILKTTVLDRSALILDIFAQRAKTREGKLQVELAQYQYYLPRLTVWNEEMGRLGGGIGTRGPGETQLETDKRYIRSRIQKLRENLEDVRKVRAEQRRRRQKNDLPVVALVGYTNAGKSTLLNRLTGADIPANDRLFDTLDTTTRQLTVSDTCQALLSDTVGFIAKLPHHLVEAFRATLEELEYADLLIHVIDSADPERDDHIAVVDRLIAELAAPGTPVLECYNKCDLVADDEIPRGQDKVAISAASGFGLDALKEAVEQLLGRGKHHVKLLLPYAVGGMVAALHDTAQVLSSSYTENGIELDAIVDETLFGRLRQYVTEEV